MLVVLHSGEKADVSLEIYVDKKTAHGLNSGEDKLYDILVLHLMGGKDIFITVSGTYRPTHSQGQARQSEGTVGEENQ